MNQKKRKMRLSFPVTLATVICLLLGMSLTAYADSTHIHGGETYLEWTDELARAQNGSSSTASNSLPKTPGFYYLTKDVFLKSGEFWDVPTGTTHLCLNNHGIIQKVGFEVHHVIEINRHETLYLYDDHTPKPTHTYSTTIFGLATVGGPGKTFTGGYITGGEGNIAGCVRINGGTFNLVGGTIIGNRTAVNGGGVNNNGGTFNMYDGAIIGNYGPRRSPMAPGGAGVYNNGTFRMWGGEISGNTTTHDGGGVYNDARGTFFMYDTAKITNNRSGRNGGGYGGGGVFNRGTFIMKGGEISGNRTSYYCGGVQNEGTFKLYSDAIIRGNFGGTSADVQGTVTIVSDSNTNGPDDNAPTWTVTVKTLTYNGNAQKLLTAGTGNSGKLYYAVTTENTAPPNESLYTTSIPTATEVGTYYVWLKIKWDDNLTDTFPVCIPVTISVNMIDENAINALPQTGDTARPLLYGLAVLVALFGLGLLIKKK